MPQQEDPSFFSLLVLIIVLAIQIYIIVQVVRSDASTPAKIGWGLGVALFPVLGTLLWLCMGPRPSDMEADWASQKAWMGTQVQKARDWISPPQQQQQPYGPYVVHGQHGDYAYAHAYPQPPPSSQYYYGNQQPQTTYGPPTKQQQQREEEEGRAGVASSYPPYYGGAQGQGAGFGGPTGFVKTEEQPQEFKEGGAPEHEQQRYGGVQQQQQYGGQQQQQYASKPPFYGGVPAETVSREVS